MDKLEVFKKTVIDLSEENKKLKEDNMQLTIINDELLAQLKDNEQNADETLARARNVASDCEDAKRQYEDCIKQLKEIKQEYETALRDVYKIKKELNDKKEYLLKQFSILGKDFNQGWKV